jgi:hypothetical protein
MQSPGGGLRDPQLVRLPPQRVVAHPSLAHSVRRENAHPQG